MIVLCSERSRCHEADCSANMHSLTCPDQMDGWMDDLRFYVLFNSISVISGRCLDDNERLCAMELRLGMRRFHLE